MLLLLKQVKGWMFVTVFVIIIVLVIFFWGRKTGKNKFNPAELPNKEKWGKELTPTEAAKVRSISGALHDDLSGYRWLKTFDIDTWREFLGLDDRMFTAVYNDYSSQYLAEGGTLKQVFRDEWTAGSAKLGEVKERILDRMDSLGLV